ncbi:MAG: DUF4031 domain-containing protein [Myxococcales bacterium]|nr:DUF4031 domain-containing protein [Myxococcales bacterium]
MIVMDAPRDWGGDFNRRWGPSCHLISDLAGEPGRLELGAFAQRLGIDFAPIQSPGTYREHHDLAGHYIARAAALGALVLERRAFVEVLRAKRAAMGG